MKNFILFIFFSGVFLPVVKSQEQFRGKVVESSEGKNLPYVNVGIVNKEAGSVSNNNGDFKFTISPDIAGTDSIRFSIIGYKSKSFTVTDFRALLKAGPAVVSLEPNITQLTPVVVTTRSRKTTVMGNTTESTFMSGGFGSKDLGSEIGIRCKVHKKDAFLESFSFFISDNKFDSLVFRVNVYDMKDGQPGGNLAPENILIHLGKEKGKITVDLSKYNIIATDDFLIALEWLSKKGQGPLFISAALFNSSTYIKKASQSAWEIKRGMGLGLNVTAKE